MLAPFAVGYTKVRYHVTHGQAWCRGLTGARAQALNSLKLCHVIMSVPVCVWVGGMRERERERERGERDAVLMMIAGISVSFMSVLVIHTQHSDGMTHV